MSVPQSVAQVLRDHVALSVECIDRMYLNLYVPILQRERGIAYFWQHHRGYIFASSALMAPMSRAFVASIERFALRHRIPVITFRKGERKDDVVRPYLAQFRKKEGVYVIGKAQEKVQVVRTVTRTNPKTGKKYPWLAKSTAMVNQYYFYALDNPGSRLRALLPQALFLLPLQREALFQRARVRQTPARQAPSRL
jgi:hypothetical protein